MEIIFYKENKEINKTVMKERKEKKEMRKDRLNNNRNTKEDLWILN